MSDFDEKDIGRIYVHYNNPSLKVVYLGLEKRKGTIYSDCILTSQFSDVFPIFVSSHPKIYMDVFCKTDQIFGGNVDKYVSNFYKKLRIRLVNKGLRIYNRINILKMKLIKLTSDVEDIDKISPDWWNGIHSGLKIPWE